MDSQDLKNINFHIILFIKSNVNDTNELNEPSSETVLNTNKQMVYCDPTPKQNKNTFSRKQFWCFSPLTLPFL